MTYAENKARSPNATYTEAQFAGMSPEDQQAYLADHGGEAPKNTIAPIDHSNEGNFLGLSRNAGAVLTLGATEALRSPDKVDTTPLDQVKARALADAVKFENERKLAAANPATAGTVTAAQVAAPERVAAPDMGKVQQVQSVDVAGPVVQPTSLATASGINDAQGQQIRASQLANAQALNDAATGKAPSVAEALYRRQAGQIAADQAGRAAAVHGTGAAGARRAAMNNTAMLQNRSSADLAAMRAGEIATARGQETGALSGIRAIDTGTAIHQADLGTRVSETNAGAENQNNQFGTAATVGVNTGNANRTVGVMTGNARAGDARTEAQAAIDLAAATGNVTRTTDVNTTNAAALNAAAVGNRDAALEAKRIQDAKDASLRVSQAGATGQAAGVAGAQVDVNAANIAAADRSAGRAADFVSGVVNKVATRGSTPPAASDERVKRDIAPVPKDAAQHLADTIQMMRFKYKDDPSAQEHFGVMAQDLEKDPLGRELVSERPDGVKQVDYQGLSALLLAAALKGRKARR